MQSTHSFGRDPPPDAMSRAPDKSARACLNCVRAKAKCSPGPGKKCERCYRMVKDCQPSPPVRKRRSGPAVSKVDRLEGKVDEAAMLVRGSSSGCAGDSTGGGGDVEQPDYPLPDVSSLPPQIVPSTTHLASEITPLEAQFYLDRFRTGFVPYLPFVIITASTTAEQLRLSSPILWLCIMTVASNNTTTQTRLSMKVREMLGREIFVKGTRNLDILQGILVYAAW